MKSLIPVVVVSGLVLGAAGCSDDPVQVEWSLALTYQSTDCGMDASPTFRLMEDDGTYRTSFVLSDGTSYDVADTTGRSIVITIASSNGSRPFDLASFRIERTPTTDAAFPDALSGVGHVERAGSYPCYDDFTLTGMGRHRDARCGMPPDDVPCATVTPFEWSTR